MGEFQRTARPRHLGSVDSWQKELRGGVGEAQAGTEGFALVQQAGELAESGDTGLSWGIGDRKFQDPEDEDAMASSLSFGACLCLENQAGSQGAVWGAGIKHKPLQAGAHPPQGLLVISNLENVAGGSKMLHSSCTVSSPGRSHCPLSPQAHTLGS